MDKIEKALQKLTDKERAIVKLLLEKLYSNTTHGLDVAQLKGYSDIYRLRKGRLRIIFRTEGAAIYLLKIDRRNEATYHDF